MARLLIALDSGNEVQPAELVAAWNADSEAQVAGTAQVGEASGSDFFPGVAELVVVPLVVNVGSSVLYDLLKRLVGRLRPDHHGERRGVEFAEVTTPGGDRVIVVRAGGMRS